MAHARLQKWTYIFFINNFYNELLLYKQRLNIYKKNLYTHWL